MTDKTEAQQEAQIQELGLTAPRVTPAMVDAMIERTEYILLPGDNHMICKLHLFGGRFHVTGENSTVSKENFNVKLAEEYSYRAAREKLWPIAGAILAYDLHNHRTTITDEKFLALDEGVRLVIIELNGVLSRLAALDEALKQEAEMLAAGVPAVEIADLKDQREFMVGYSNTLQKRLARIGL